MDKLTTYIALLRGINVGGHRPLKMDELREMFLRMGFENISTYIQSGNVIFNTPSQDEHSLSNRIKDHIADTFDYKIPVVVYTAQSLKQILEQFPFIDREGWKNYITFLSAQPSRGKIKNLEALSNNIENFKVGDRVVYIQLDKQSDKKTRFSNRFIQQHLDTSATNRNLKSVRKLVKLSSVNS
ncbi:DUF1697 domain-containing protein [Fodinibius sp.]|uniref:DUF1697 domain-containing protein n=1 Tax=Fodinibius sp. TaxID=1872440 RepID=UPI002ACD4EE2|nr:DUF1697 domain-containing protein [Fodinibius sp.]MDZ7659093.1 DUF1697 domain-containing protein [Fodinibius sp.]